jgi:hypothetical protein
MARTKITMTEKIDAVFSMLEALAGHPGGFHLGFTRRAEGWEAVILQLESAHEGNKEFASRLGPTVEAALAGLTDEIGKKVEEQRISMTIHLDAALEKSGRVLKAAKTLLASGIDEEEVEFAQ